MNQGSTSIQVSLTMGSESDWKMMKEATKALEEFEIGYEAKVVSAHRSPDWMYEFARGLVDRGVQVVIAGAGGAAHLPGMLASLTPLPVIGVPLSRGALQGEDSLLSIVQMPKGVPVATVAIDAAYNAGILAAQILASGGSKIQNDRIHRIGEYKEELRKKVLSMTLD